jgi:hypothetical protein
MATYEDELVSSGAVKTFAVLCLTDLRIFLFESKDDMHDAIIDMRDHDEGFVPLLWNARAKTWTIPETWQ